MGPNLCQREQSGQAADVLVPLPAAPTQCFSGAFPLGPELQGAPFTFLPAKIISTMANKHSLRDFFFFLNLVFLLPSCPLGFDRVNVPTTQLSAVFAQTTFMVCGLKTEVAA